MVLEIAKISLGPMFILIIVGCCLLSSLLGAGIISPIMAFLFEESGSYSQKSTHKYAFAVGVIERFFYTFAVCFGAYIMIGGWLVLKTFSNIDSEKRDIGSFYSYLFGNIFSLTIGTSFGFIAMFLTLTYAYK